MTTDFFCWDLLCLPFVFFLIDKKNNFYYIQQLIKSAEARPAAHACG